MPPFRWSRVAALVAGVGTLALAAVSMAAPCGGAVQCLCGDTVIADTKLTYDIGVCNTTGLRIAAGIDLDCAGHAITGTNVQGSSGSKADYGIHLDGAVGAIVRRCRVGGFGRGFRINGGQSNSLIKNQTFVDEVVDGNLVPRTNKSYGLDLAGGTSHNLIRRNLVQYNRDEGVHLGESDYNRFEGNDISENKREGIYLLSSHRNRFANNIVYKNDAAAIFVKHSQGNYFMRNFVRDGALHVRGDSTGNRFRGNYLKNNGYVFEALEEPAGVWTYPHDNRLTGECIRKTDVCFRFEGAYDNVATRIRPGTQCMTPPDGMPFTEAEAGGLTPSGNQIELLNTCNDDPAWAVRLEGALG